MPPKSAKRGAAAKRARVSSKAAIENQQQKEPEAVEVVVKNHEEIPVAEITVEENHEENSVPNGLAVVANDGEEVKESIDECEKDEHLDLEDNDPEYEHEEDRRVDYDDRKIEQDEGQEVGDEMEEELEDNVGEEEDGTDDEEVEYVYEEIEGDDDDDDDDGGGGGDDNAGDGDNASDDEDAGEEYEHEHPADVEEEEHHERKVIKEKKQKEFEVFVGGLDKDASERDLRKVFSKVGVITDVRLTMNPQTKRNTGFALIRFETTEQAKNALAELKNPVINGKHCGVTQCKDSDTLYLGNICEKWEKEALKEKLKHYGVENFEDLTLVEDGNNEGMNCGFAFLEFASRSDAEEAYRRLQKRDAVFGVDKPAMVSFTDAFIDLDEEIMAQVKTVFIDLLPSSWNEDFVRGLLKKYGEIEKVELARDMPSARRNNYGFVSFATHAAAVECADSITSAGLGEGSKKAKVRARLSRPNRSRGKRIAQRDSYSGRKVGRLARPSRNRPVPQSRPAPRSRPTRVLRRIGNRISPVRPSRVRDKRPAPPVRPSRVRDKRPAPPVRPSRVRDKRPVPPVRPSRVRDKRPVTSMPVRVRPATPPARSYDRRLTAAYPKSSMKRDYGRSMDLPPPRNRVSEDYGSQRRPSYRDYPANVSGYPDLHRSTPGVVPTRRDSLDDGYGQRLERPPHLSHREGHSHDYDTLSGSKRPYTAIDDISPRYADAGAHQSRPRLVDYDYVDGASQFREAYGDRLGRSSLGYSGSRSSISIQNSHGTYSSQQGTSYGRGSFGGSDGGIYSSSYAGDYILRESDVGGSSYSSMYSSRGVNGGSSYMGGGGGSRSYY